MKKKDLRLLFVFGVLLLLFALAGCSPAEQETGETTEQKTQESTETGNIELSNAEFVELDRDLVPELIKYLQEYNYEYFPPTASFSVKLNRIKKGEQALGVTFDPTAYYFACAYYNAPHEFDHIGSDFCCAEKYTWVGFQNANEILEYYNGEKLITAFQINRASTCRNVLADRNYDPAVEHYQLIKLTFSDGKNITPPLNYDISYVFLTKSKEDIVYYTDDVRLHWSNSFPCVVLDGECYITEELYSEYPDGSQLLQPSELPLSDFEIYYREVFGEYYDDLMRIMITDQYSETYENGTLSHFGLFKIEDIAEIIFHRKEYKLTVYQSENILLTPLKDSYPAGEEVVFRVEFITDVSIKCYINGQLISEGKAVREGVEWVALEFRFKMPAANTELKILMEDVVWN